MDSEVDLDEEIKKLHPLAAAPELYPDMVKLGALKSLSSLLTHENSGRILRSPYYLYFL
jgi:beta-catenin-like protein 1